MTVKELLERYAAGERDFARANLRGANLRDANLRDANLTGAKISASTVPLLPGLLRIEVVPDPTPKGAA